MIIKMRVRGLGTANVMSCWALVKKHPQIWISEGQAQADSL